MKSYLNAQDVAKILKIHRSTIIRWIKQGRLPGATRIPGTRDWRIPLPSFQEFLKHHHEDHQF